MEHEERIGRRDSFRRDASDYAAIRPEYPERALRDAAGLAGLGPGAAVLEVGCGTGQATLWLAERGYRVLALDIAVEMAEVASAATAAYPTVEVRLQDFEALTVEEAYDALVFATSYHWLNPADRAGRCADHLRSGGALILLWHTHPPPFTGFHARVQHVYRKYLPAWEPPSSPGMVEERIQNILSELASSGRYETPQRRSYDWTERYARAAYLRLLTTYSDHALLPEATRMALLADIGALIDAEYGGSVDRPYRTELVVARRG